MRLIAFNECNTRRSNSFRGSDLRLVQGREGEEQDPGRGELPAAGADDRVPPRPLDLARPAARRQVSRPRVAHLTGNFRMCITLM